MTRACLAAALLALALPVAAQDVAIKAGHVVVRSDSVLEKATVLLRKGRVVEVGTDVTIPDGVLVIERPDAWVLPAFVDASTGLGLIGDRDETADAVASDLNTQLLVDPTHRDFAAARAAGIGTCAIVPGDLNLFGGEGSLVKSSGELLGGVAKLALGPSVLRPGRTPTSRSGVVDLLRRTLEQAHAAENAAGALGRFASGSTVGIATVGGPQDVLNLIELTDRYGLRLALRPMPSVEVKDLEGLPLAGRTLILGPYPRNAPARVLKLAGAASAQGANLAFSTNGPTQPAAGLRQTAAIAIRHGLAAERALHALTQGGAEALGLGDRVGSLEHGKDGDVTVLSGPPLDLRSRVLELYVGGRRVYSRPALEEKQ